ncbi:carbohydrate-binding family 9-like protein [Puteibacter caeruleilacunae]|nr:carbohydrate-binding family 9-like protein [Puteibacter caeruleilacunae]
MKRRFKWLLLLPLAGLFLANCMPGSKNHNDSNGIAYGVKKPEIPFAPKGYVCYKTAGEMNIDGKIDEASWDKATWTDYFVDIEGDAKPKPRFKTRAKMLWDDNYLYIAAKLEEPHIWGNLTDRDAVIFYDNDFEVFIDPDGDTHGYYEFEMNALNTVWDLLLIRPYRQAEAVLDSWNYNGMKSGVHIEGTLNDGSDEDKYWTVEMAFPMTVLEEYNHGRRPKQGDQWRINFSRVEWQTDIVDGKYVKRKDDKGKNLHEDNWVWSPQGRIAMHMPELWGFLQFSEKSVGSSNEKFKFNDEEFVKWELRNIYYAQQEYIKKHGGYAAEIKDLTKVGLNMKALKYDPKIYVTPSLYEITAQKPGSKYLWHIDNFGKTWRSNSK